MKERLLLHWEEHKQFYYGLGLGIALAGITYAITRDVKSQSISPGISVTAQRGISVLGKKIEMNNVSYVSVERSGPPSWVVRCVETGVVFLSQSAAAEAMDLPYREISKHLNGTMDHVRGYTFERLCMAAS